MNRNTTKLILSNFGQLRFFFFPLKLKTIIVVSQEVSPTTAVKLWWYRYGTRNLELQQKYIFNNLSVGLYWVINLLKFKMLHPLLPLLMLGP